MEKRKEWFDLDEFLDLQDMDEFIDNGSEPWGEFKPYTDEGLNIVSTEDITRRDF